ncbi:MAG: HAMP domain-containing protein [Vicinamibacteria bacterium]|nr:HAMP domain-containing protein [Vicinamibacteria bacterium]
MTLRSRLILALAGSGLAILLGSFVAREIAIRYASEASIHSSIEARLSSLDRETCESGRDLERREFRPRRPDDLGGPRPGPFGEPEFRRGPPPEGIMREREREREAFGPRFGAGPFGGPRMTRVFFYDPDFKPRRPEEPPFPDAAKARLRAGEALVNGSEAFGFFGAVATSWTGGACTYALAIMPTPPPLASFTMLIVGALLLIGFPAIALWFALAKPVARIRTLAAGVRETAARHYETSVVVSGEDEIAELGRAFNEASTVVRAHVAEVERREKSLRDFVAHTTHDVALPLSVLLSHVTRLRQSAPEGASNETIAAIAQETQYIASLLANLEAVARLEADAALQERHPVDLTALVERVAARHRGVASSGGVDFNHSAPPTGVWVIGDVTLIEQAVNNLVHNAIQYNHAGGHVALVLDVDAAVFTLRVSDDGPGVQDRDLARLGLDRFRSEEARSRRPNGMGLGLSIARDVARRHGFTLTLGNRAEGGFEAVLAGSIDAKGSAEKNPRS